MGAPPRTPYPPDLPEDAEEGLRPELGDLRDMAVDGADWANRRAFKASLTRVELRRCRLTGAELAEAVLTDVVLADCHLELAGLRFTKLQRVVFRDCRMRESDFHGASLEDVLFERCDLREATLAGAKMERVEMQGCELAALCGVESLRSVRMPWNDVLANAPLFANAVGIEIVD
ncbi:MAG TPA: pentapeptide repeat-containing protein [Gaiellaceae bacterium]